jgi:hypothetical protein
MKKKYQSHKNYIFLTRVRGESIRARVESTRAECSFDTHMCHSFFKQSQLCACILGLCFYCNKNVQHATYEIHMHECENHTQRVKITVVRVI